MNARPTSGEGVVVAVTADPVLRQRWRDCAVRAGTHLREHGSVATARGDWADAGLVLLGGDLAPAAAQARMPRTATTILVAAGPLDIATFVAAEAVRASYVVVLPVGADWLVQQLARYATPVLTQLRTADVTVAPATSTACT
ncbi:hypothetical protein [Krasilnikovia sp. M28-CT-15]|uniref:hypothetical protein n=1 Tax=Krasilnikovia sp. M28-CT-15 TaxID=3373540 RepID=UPI003875BA7C